MADSAYLLIKMLELFFAIFVVLTFICAVAMFLLDGEIKKKSRDELKIFRSIGLLAFIAFIVVMVALIHGASIIKRIEVGADRVSKLAEAESTLHQIALSNKLAKTPAVDPKLADQWILDMRKAVDTGVLSYGQFKELAERYNDLGVGQESVRRWFKDNTSESIKDALLQQAEAQMNTAKPVVQSDVSGLDESERIKRALENNM